MVFQNLFFLAKMSALNQSIDKYKTANQFNPKTAAIVQTNNMLQ